MESASASEDEVRGAGLFAPLVKLTDSAHEKTTEGLEKKWCFVGFSDIF